MQRCPTLAATAARTNRDVVAIAEHGCGKTLAYAVPLLIRAAALQGQQKQHIAIEHSSPCFVSDKSFYISSYCTMYMSLCKCLQLHFCALDPRCSFSSLVYEERFQQGARHEQPDLWRQSAWQDWRQRPPDGVILVPTSEIVQQVRF